MRLIILLIFCTCVSAGSRRFEYGKIVKSQKTLDLKREILHLLGLDRQPRPNLHTRLLGKRLSAPRFMMELYKSLSYNISSNNVDAATKGVCCTNNSIADANVIGADTIVSFLHRVKVVRPKMSSLHTTYNFELNSGPEDDEEIIACELRLYKDPTSSHDNSWQNTTFRVTLNQVVKPGKIIHALQTITLRSWESGWQVFDVSKAARIWKKVPGSNQGLELVVKTYNGDTVKSAHAGFVGFHGDTAKRPFMVTFFREYLLNDVQRRYRRSRVRRSSTEPSQNLETHWKDLAGYSSLNTYRQGGRRSCQRRALYVSFRDLGWQNWIIAPDGYSAFFCHGECSFPLNSHMNATNHAIVQTLVHLMNPDTVPEPCCAPTELSGISVLYFDDNSNVVLKKYKKMAVKACGCH